ncbi:MAG TPA: hypothetical protein PLQ41_07025, partial [bacterium]|nr:hypothetical protein [bacterium]
FHFIDSIFNLCLSLKTTDCPVINLECVFHKYLLFQFIFKWAIVILSFSPSPTLSHRGRGKEETSLNLTLRLRRTGFSATEILADLRHRGKRNPYIFPTSTFPREGSKEEHVK